MNQNNEDSANIKPQMMYRAKVTNSMPDTPMGEEVV